MPESRKRGKQRIKPRDETERPAERRDEVALLYLLSFFSGVAALVYEVTWARMLALTFGSTTLSAAAVIAGFMGGMGLGAWLYHRVHDRLYRPLLTYGCLEVGIAMSAALLTVTFYWLPQLFGQVLAAVPPGPWLVVVRFATVVALLLIPALLMGATFPALCTVMIRTVWGVDRHLGMIYGLNTIGAAAGVLLAGLVLIEQLGLRASVAVANAINAAVGATALALVWRRGEGSRVGVAKAGETTIPTFLPRWLTGGVLFLSGFATLSYEVFWLRALRYLVGNSVYALTTVLFIFLVGLGLGSLLLRRCARRQRPERDLALCQCAIAVLALGTMACQWAVLSHPVLHDYVSIYSTAMRARPWGLRLLLDAGVAMVTMLPATLFMGLSFPLASRLFLGDIRRLGAGVGGAYLLASLGSILGAVAAAVVLLPHCGTIGGTKVAAAVNLTLGVVLALWIRGRASGCLSRVGTAVVAAAALFAVLPSSMRFRGEKLGRSPGPVVFFAESDVATVQVLQEPDNPARRVMTIDGCRIGWGDGYRNDPMYRKQVVLAHLPMVLDTRLRRTLNVGLGSAATLHALASYPQVETLDCVEINEAVVRASRLFRESAVLNDPRVTLIVDDAVHYLLRSTEQYDLIISDGKQDPFYSGNAVLLCREYYGYARARLSPRGLFVQWIPLGTLSADLRINLRTLCDVFPYVHVFYLPRRDAFMVGSVQPLSGRPRLGDEAYRGLRVHDDLYAYYIDSPAALRSRWTANRRGLARVLGDGPISTWDQPRLDFSPFKATPADEARAHLDNLHLLLTAEPASASGEAVGLDPADAAYGQSSALVRRAFLALFAGRLSQARSLANQAVQANPRDAAANAVLRELMRYRPAVPEDGSPGSARGAGSQD